jgi:hypothetical protein
VFYWNWIGCIGGRNHFTIVEVHGTKKNQKKQLGESGVGFLDSLVGLILDKDLSTLKHNLIIP